MLSLNNIPSSCKKIVIYLCAPALCACTALKVAHQLPLQGLQKKYTQQFFENKASLSNFSWEFFRNIANNIEISIFSNDTIIIVTLQDNERKYYYLTCLEWGEYCLLRSGDNLSIKLTWTVFGDGDVIPRNSVQEALKKRIRVQKLTRGNSGTLNHKA